MNIPFQKYCQNLIYNPLSATIIIPQMGYHTIHKPSTERQVKHLYIYTIKNIYTVTYSI